MNSFKELFESPVGQRGRTGAADAKAHVTPELRAEFKKLVKQLGGKAVARELLNTMNANAPMSEGKPKASDTVTVKITDIDSAAKDKKTLKRLGLTLDTKKSTITGTLMNVTTYFVSYNGWDYDDLEDKYPDIF